MKKRVITSIILILLIFLIPLVAAQSDSFYGEGDTSLLPNLGLIGGAFFLPFFLMSAAYVFGALVLVTDNMSS